MLSSFKVSFSICERASSYCLIISQTRPWVICLIHGTSSMTISIVPWHHCQYHPKGLWYHFWYLVFVILRYTMHTCPNVSIFVDVKKRTPHLLYNNTNRSSILWYLTDVYQVYAFQNMSCVQKRQVNILMILRMQFLSDKVKSMLCAQFT